MDGIKIEVTGNIARVIERPEKITSGTIGMPVEFIFDSPWDTLTKMAVFRAGCRVIDVINPGDGLVVPWEVLENPGPWLSVGVYGINDDGTIAIPTIWANIGVIFEGVDPDGDPSVDPTLPIWREMINYIESMESLGRDGKSAYEVAVQNGYDGTEEEWLRQLRGQPGAPGHTPVKGIDYFTEVDKKEIVDSVTNSVDFRNLQEDVAGLEGDILEIWEKLNYKAITISQFSNSAAGKHEIGTVIDTVKLSWSLNKTPASQTLDGVTLGNNVRSTEYTGLSIASNKTYTLSVKDEKGATDKASSSITFCNGVYYGVCADGADVKTVLSGLDKELRGDRVMTFTANAEKGQRHIYAIPHSYGTPTFKDAETGFQAVFYLEETFAFTNSSGHKEPYDVWLSAYPGLGKMTVSVS